MHWFPINYNFKVVGWEVAGNSGAPIIKNIPLRWCGSGQVYLLFAGKLAFNSFIGKGTGYGAKSGVTVNKGNITPLGRVFYPVCGVGTFAGAANSNRYVTAVAGKTGAAPSGKGISRFYRVNKAETFRLNIKVGGVSAFNNATI